MTRRKPRGLRRDEIDLWAKVVEHAVPLRDDRLAKAETPRDTAPVAKQSPTAVRGFASVKLRSPPTRMARHAVP